ncbi:hypothetical protein LOTGIDRAFT_165135 [Lottia gigantea]|uniref:Uncharacterized protein n=1 Tax=Lottia gigantea TaxID=225164 RepID=V4BLI7_LOTGI|nr:hypothetical protein LOTGIDRAFT_165135 [Lottia gigantea]ESO89544.1 hypothetical protein LOTGIDRAFT_165135 [Lottia gigantea]
MTDWFTSDLIKVISVVCLGFYLFRYIALDAISKSIEFKGIIYAGFVLYSLLIAVSLILLPGVYMDKRYLMLPWIYVLVVTVLYETGAVALLTTVHLEYEKKLQSWEIISVCFYMLRLVANCYCFACVVSQYQELTEGRGTYEFLYKPSSSSPSDVEVYTPPFGANLPPYSIEDQHKEFSPPPYDNLSFETESDDVFRTATSACIHGECRHDLLNDISECCAPDVTSRVDRYDPEYGVLQDAMSGSVLTHPVPEYRLPGIDYQMTTHLTWL